MESEGCIAPGRILRDAFNTVIHTPETCRYCGGPGARPCQMHGAGPCPGIDTPCVPRIPNVHVIRPPSRHVQVADGIKSFTPEITISLGAGAGLIVFDFARGVISIASEGALKGQPRRAT